MQGWHCGEGVEAGIMIFGTEVSGNVGYLGPWRQPLLNINTPDCRLRCGGADCYALVRATRTDTPRSMCSLQSSWSSIAPAEGWGLPEVLSRTSSCIRNT